MLTTASRSNSSLIVHPLTVILAFGLAASAAADVTSRNTTRGGDGSEIISDPLVAQLEIEGGTAGNLWVVPNQESAVPVSGELRLDAENVDDGVTQLEIGGRLLIGSESGNGTVTVAGRGAAVTVAEGVNVTNGSALNLFEGARVTTTGPIAIAGGTELSDRAQLTVIRDARLSTTSTDSYKSGGRINIGAPDGGFNLNLHGGSLAALSETGADHGAGTITIEGSGTMGLGVDSPSNGLSGLVAQHQINIAAQSASIWVGNFTSISQLDMRGGEAVGLRVVASPASPDTGGISMSLSGYRTFVNIADHIQLGDSYFGQVEFSVTDYATVTTGGSIQLGTAGAAQTDPIPVTSTPTTVLAIDNYGQLQAEKVIINPNARLRAGLSNGAPPSLWQGSVSADVELAGGELEAVAAHLEISGDLDLTHGAVTVARGEAGGMLRVGGTAIFGEGSLLRVLVDAVPEGGEVLLDDYLLADRYEFTPQFMLSAQLEVVVRSDLLAGQELMFRFSSLDQTYRYRVPTAVVPELNGSGAGLGLGLMAAVVLWRRERCPNRHQLKAKP